MKYTGDRALYRIFTITQLIIKMMKSSILVGLLPFYEVTPVLTPLV